MRNSLLRRIADRQIDNVKGVHHTQLDLNDDNFIPFEFEGDNYYLALRDNALVFDSGHVLLYTIDYNSLTDVNAPIFEKVKEIIETIKLKDVNNNLVKLGVRRDGVLNSIYFTSKFDAVFIFKKLKRVASRPAEDIDELIIVKDDVVIDRFEPGKTKRFHRFNRDVQTELESTENLSVVSKLTRVEDILEGVINEKINNISLDINNDSIDKCIELLKQIKNEM